MATNRINRNKYVRGPIHAYIYKWSPISPEFGGLKELKRFNNLLNEPPVIVLPPPLPPPPPIGDPLFPPLPPGVGDCLPFDLNAPIPPIQTPQQPLIFPPGGPNGPFWVEYQEVLKGDFCSDTEDWVVKYVNEKVVLPTVPTLTLIKLSYVDCDYVA